LHSDALIELFATVIGVAFSAVLESVSRNLTWSVRIVSRYKGDPHGGAAGLAIASLDRTSPIASSGRPSQEVEYVAFFRDKGLTAIPISLGSTLQGLLRDLTAYIDASYQQFRKDRRFPEIFTDSVESILGQIIGNVFTLRANSLTAGTVFGELPRPVLRAYFGNQMVVMAPGPNLDDDYEMQFDFPSLPRKDFEVTVVSSRGGVTKAVVNVS
jgi:hypothetical protein